ncbi:MAG: hypothetical protein ABSE73_14405, partial [Planctomycetota bacterium]
MGLLSRSSKKRAAEKFRGRVVDDAAHWLARRLEHSEDTVRAALCDRHDAAELESVERVECEVEKLDRQVTTRTFILIHTPSGQVETGEIIRDLLWEDLPGDIREEFIQHGEKKLRIVVLDKQVAAGDDVRKSEFGRRIDSEESLSRIKGGSGSDSTGVKAAKDEALRVLESFEPRKPLNTLKDVVLPARTRSEVDVLMSRIRNHTLLYEQWGLK